MTSLSLKPISQCQSIGASEGTRDTSKASGIRTYVGTLHVLRALPYKQIWHLTTS